MCSFFIYFYLTLNNTKHFSHKHFVSHLFVCELVSNKISNVVAPWLTCNSMHAEQSCVDLMLTTHFYR